MYIKILLGFYIVVTFFGFIICVLANVDFPKGIMSVTLPEEVQIYGENPIRKVFGFIEFDVIL